MKNYGDCGHWVYIESRSRSLYDLFDRGLVWLIQKRTQNQWTRARRRNEYNEQKAAGEDTAWWGRFPIEPRNREKFALLPLDFICISCIDHYCHCTAVKLVNKSVSLRLQLNDRVPGRVVFALSCVSVFAKTTSAMMLVFFRRVAVDIKSAQLVLVNDIFDLGGEGGGSALVDWTTSTVRGQLTKHIFVM